MTLSDLFDSGENHMTGNVTGRGYVCSTLVLLCGKAGFFMITILFQQQTLI